METIGNLNAIAAVLRRRSPDAVTRLSRHPDIRTVLEERRPLGPGPGDALESSTATPFIELAEQASRDARSDLDEVLAKLSARARTLARLRLGAGCVSTVSAAGLLALLMGKNFSAQFTTAMISLLSSLLGLVGTYIEDYSGGDGSTRRLRELMASQVKALADADGRLRIARIQCDKGELVAILQALNGILGEVQFARAQLGMPI